MNVTASQSGGALSVRAWPSERPLYVLILLISLAWWLVLTITLIGLFYAAMLGLFFMLTRAAFIAHLRGSAVRIGPNQLPELHERVVAISSRLGLPKTPDAYVLQQGGALNALATRFAGSEFIVLYSDLLDACGDNTEACDFIVAHELGHLRAGHLRGRWLIIPGLLTPFLGAAYSRACEYTSDRYGLAVARDRDRALDGLVILAAGARQAPHINRRALVAQTHDMRGFWMTLGQWLATHPPIADRLGILDTALASERAPQRSAMLAIAILAFSLVIPTLSGVGLFTFYKRMLAQAASMRPSVTAPATFNTAPTAGPAVGGEADEAAHAAPHSR